MIGIQGYKGSYHHLAAEDYFGENISILECRTFDEVAKNIKEGTVDKGIMAIENSIAGSILPNYAVIDQMNLNIQGETFLSIDHNLMSLSGQSIEDIREVYSHPMALLQCKKFFNLYPHILLVESIDTAYEAKRISENNLSGIGAIAGKKAAEMYGLEIISKSIQTIKNNVTRFVIVEQNSKEKIDSKINKASLKFILGHQKGSLATVLNVMSDCGINLTKIQSLPIIETPGKYAFFVDVEFDEYENFAKAKKIIEVMATQFKILGEYFSAKQ